MSTTFFESGGTTYRGTFDYKILRVIDPKTQNEINTSGTLIIHDRVVILSVEEIITIDGQTYRVVSREGLNTSVPGRFSLYGLVLVSRSERVY